MARRQNQDPDFFVSDPDADPDPDFYLFRIRMRIRILNLFYADPDLTFHPDVDPAPGPSFQIRAQTLEKVLK